MNVRPVKKEEINDVIEFGKKFHEEAKGHNSLPFDVEKLRHFGHNLWHTDPRFFHLGAFDKDGKPYGVFVGYLEQYFFNNEFFATDMMFYIEKSKRGGFAAIKMIKLFEKWAKASGAKHIRPATSSGIDINRTKDFYKAMKYEVTGYNFRKDIV